MNVVYKVVAEINVSSGRFLEKDDDGWWRESHDVDAVVTRVKTMFQRTNRKDTPQRKHLNQVTPDEVVDYTTMFLQQGKRPKFDNGCCGT